MACTLYSSLSKTLFPDVQVCFSNLLLTRPCIISHLAFTLLTASSLLCPYIEKKIKIYSSKLSQTHSLDSQNSLPAMLSTLLCSLDFLASSSPLHRSSSALSISSHPHYSAPSSLRFLGASATHRNTGFSSVALFRRSKLALRASAALGAR